MVGTATHANGILLQSTETGNRLAGIENFSFASLQSFLESMGNRGHTGKLLDKIQKRAFARQEFVRRTVHFGNQVTLLHDIAVFLVESHLHVCLEFLEHKFNHRKACEHAIFLGNQAGMLLLVSRDRPFARHVTRANVLGKRQANHGQSIFGRKNRGGIVAVHYCAPLPVRTT